MMLYGHGDWHQDTEKCFTKWHCQDISLHSIEDGIPLRVFDIMGVGGFMLSNYQPAMDELFAIGQDIEVFHDIEELEDKVDYYLSHEDQRIKNCTSGI